MEMKSLLFGLAFVRLVPSTAVVVTKLDAVAKCD